MKAIPGCKPWRKENPRSDGKSARFCPSAYCPRCAKKRVVAQVEPVLPNDFLIPLADREALVAEHLDQLGVR
jgi:hypothetical protein